MALRKKCDSTYAKDIHTRTDSLQKKLMDLTEKEHSLANKKRQGNTNLIKMQNDFKKLRVRDSLAYRDTSANRMKHRKDVQNERLAAMIKMRTEEGKLNNDLELVTIRQSIAVLRKQIEDSTVVIVKDDPDCISCYRAN